MVVPQKNKNRITIDPAIPLLATYLKKTKNTNSQRYLHPMFIRALFTIAKTWKQSKCPLSGKWTKKM